MIGCNRFILRFINHFHNFPIGIFSSQIHNQCTLLAYRMEMLALRNRLTSSSFPIIFLLQGCQHQQLKSPHKKTGFGL